MDDSAVHSAAPADSACAMEYHRRGSVSAECSRNGNSSAQNSPQEVLLPNRSIVPALSAAPQRIPARCPESFSKSSIPPQRSPAAVAPAVMYFRFSGEDIPSYAARKSAARPINAAIPVLSEAIPQKLISGWRENIPERTAVRSISPVPAISGSA